ncbi:epoxide hydrolase [Artemisia annua]|uniref:Epoxide hydrolase n=1 Tax=Artemisia annua TaxID=35608 RepID=A0A2U1LMI3_ARTAN|nr:epoxide hydrolase [Artemisia annua]
MTILSFDVNKVVKNEIGWEEEYAKVDTKKQLAAAYFKRSPSPPKLPKDYAKVFNPPPYTLPSWFTEEDLEYFASKYSATGFTGGFNYYRCYDLNWELCAAWMGSKIKLNEFILFNEMKKNKVVSGGAQIKKLSFNSVTALIFVYFKGMILFRVWLFIECGCDGWCSSKWTTWILYWLNRGMIHLSVYLWLRFQSFSASDQTSGIIVIARISDSVGVPIATTATESLTDLSETQDAPTPRTSSRSPAGKSYNVLRGYMEYFCSVLTFGFALKEVCVSVLGYLNRFSKGEFWETRSSSLVLVESFEKMMEDPKCTKDGLIRKMVLEPCGNNEGGMEVPVAEVVQNVTRISLDELMRSRPREAQVKAAGMLFGMCISSFPNEINRSFALYNFTATRERASFAEN